MTDYMDGARGIRSIRQYWPEIKTHKFIFVFIIPTMEWVNVIKCAISMYDIAHTPDCSQTKIS